MIHRRGSYIIEVLISAVVLAIFALALGSLLAISHRAVTSSRLEQQASAYAKEGVELAVAQKDHGWDLLPIGVRPTESLSGGFTRQIQVDEGHRSGGKLDQSGADPDINIRYIQVRVSWNEALGPQSLTYAQYVAKW